MPELTWVAVYNDGTVLPQRNGDGSENRYGDIDRSNLVEFHLYERNGNGRGRLRYALYLDPGQRLIWRRRVVMRADSEGKTISEVAFHLAGWQMTVGKQNVQSIAYVPEEAPHTFMAGRFREDHPLFYAAIAHPNEGE
ncbi:hypothetical protein LCGC14_0856480 [marine sediment metagenome]|uniref:Uncharacterized protein n=1 Tax=marine sediment metagenome TaxID=412755 RepID=A0A0F9SFU1_9ZZZZ